MCCESFGTTVSRNHIFDDFRRLREDLDHGQVRNKSPTRKQLKMDTKQKTTGAREFIALMALLMSFVALSIDAMLPALGDIGKDLAIKNPNDAQFIVSSVFLGMSLGLMFYGPISDAYGRIKTLSLGISIFLLGTVVCLFAENFTLMLIGRVVQGFGGASCRVLTMAMIRDSFSGKEMARVMSLIVILFVLVPALAPFVGQLILLFSGWRAIFKMFFVVAVIALLWLNLRQKETLHEALRIKLTRKNVVSGIKETIFTASSRSYMIASGLIFGSMIGYISSAQQIFQIKYRLAENFVFVFGGLALFVGLASFFNSRLVMRFKVENLALVALSLKTIAGLAFTIYLALGYSPSLILLLVFLSFSLFCIGLLYGNINTLALVPLGHIAGVANSVVGAVQTFISVAIGAFIGQMYDGTLFPLAVGFLFCGLFALLFTLYGNRVADYKSI